jgi:hypothetical protein
MKTLKIIFICIVAMGFFQCKTDYTEKLDYLSEDMLTLSSVDSHLALPYLFTNSKGKTYLSFLEKNDSINQLKYAVWEEGKWSTPQLITEGKNWFVNWADYPQIAEFSDGTLIACFLEKNGEGRFAYQIKYTLSKNGVEWTSPKVLHQDGTETEHGFLSMATWNDNVFISWLDGRNTGSGSHDAGHEGHDDHGHHGSMNLRGALLNSAGEILEDQLLDDRVCDCCQTHSVITSNGPNVFYRDRSEAEVRDISMVNWNKGSWNSHGTVYKDNWEVSGCPVNGPRAAALKESVALAWFTGRNNSPEVKVVFSEDGGKSFGSPIRIDNGNTIGRVDIGLIDADNAWVTWIENNKIFSRIVNSNGNSSAVIPVGSTSEKRSSGFPQMSLMDKSGMFAWTDDSGDKSVIHTKIISLKN